MQKSIPIFRHILMTEKWAKIASIPFVELVSKSVSANRVIVITGSLYCTTKHQLHTLEKLNIEQDGYMPPPAAGLRHTNTCSLTRELFVSTLTLGGIHED